jgi:hypothetical protein
MNSSIEAEWGTTVRPIIKLISFGSGLPGIELALARLRKQVELFDLIDQVETYTEHNLDSDYYQMFQGLLSAPSRGFGYWSWKPYLISRELDSLREGDVLIYLDAGVEINLRGQDRFAEYLDLVSQQDVLIFTQPTQQRHWTKESEVLVPIDRHYFRNQVVAGILMFRVSDKSKKLVRKWLNLSSKDGGALLADPGVLPAEDRRSIKAHRHDQSVLSRVVFEEATPVIQDETYFEPWSKGRKAPFLALRNKQTGASWIWPAVNLPRPIFLLWQFLTLIFTPGVLASKMKRRLR